MGSTLIQMQEKVYGSIKLVPVNAGPDLDDRVNDRVAEAKKHLIGMMAWWYNRSGTVAPGDGVAFTDEFEMMWYQLSMAMCYPLVGQDAQAAAMMKAYQESVSMFMGMDNQTQ